MKLLIVGGVAGGATAAARARRLNEEAEIVLFERGEFVSFANCGLPYYIGGVINKRESLLVITAAEFKKRHAVDIRVCSDLTVIDRERRLVEVKNLATGETCRESYDRIIMSPGAEPVKLPIQGVDLDNIFHLRSLPDSGRIKAFVDEHQPESAVIVGDGFIGLEMAENLAIRGIKTAMPSICGDMWLTGSWPRKDSTSGTQAAAIRPCWAPEKKSWLNHLAPGSGCRNKSGSRPWDEPAPLLFKPMFIRT